MPSLFPTGAAAAEVEDAEDVVVDLNARVVAAKPDADINALIPQPPGSNGKFGHGAYLLRARLLDRGDIANPKPGLTKEKVPFVTVGLELEIVDEGSEFHGFKMNKYINSLVQKMRQTSDVHWFMNCIGETLPEDISLGELIEKIKSALESEPMINSELEWRASRKIGQGKYDYEDVATRMMDFPKSPDGDGHIPVYTYKDPKSGEKTEHRAMAYVSKFLSQS